MPTSLVLPRVNSYLLRNLLIALLSVGVSIAFVAQADDFDAAKTSSTLKSSSLVSTQQDDFLPVTQAYKVSADVKPQHLRLTWTIADGYYLYQERFKFKATPEVALEPTYSDGGKKKFDEFAGKDMTLHYHQVTVDFALAANTPAFDLRVTSQGCAEAGLCYPPHSETLHIDPAAGTGVPVANEPAKSSPAITTSTPGEPLPTKKSDEPSLWVAQALVFALLGGIILNLMPCVFPVLSIKVLSLVQADGQRLRAHGWAYTLGIVLCFIGFASILLIAKGTGQAIGWGFQLQSPGLVTALAYLFFVMGLSMSGVIQFGTQWMGAGQALTQKSGLQGSFFTGVLAAIVASPCTAPFMGAALGFALTQPAYVCLGVFAALGLGMALPLLMLCYWPALAERLPKPGLWMENLKEFLAFPLYLSAAWLLWVLANQGGTNLMAGVCVGAVFIAFACWLLSRPSQGNWRFANRAIALVALIAALLLPYQLLQKPTSNSRWQAWSSEKVDELRSQGRGVFVDFTADWCLTCLANERVTLTKPEVEAAFDAHKVVTLKGDWTNSDAKISEILKEYGRSGVPLYLWYPPNTRGKAQVLPQLLTPGLVIDTIDGKN